MWPKVMWVEVLSRGHQVLARHRFEADEVRIGRGYANDVFLDDPRVAPDHLRIFRDETGALHAEIKDGRGVLSTPIDPDQPLRLGNSLVRVREAAYALAPAPAQTGAGLRWAGLIAFPVAILLIQLLSNWLQQTSDPGQLRAVMPAIWTVVKLVGVLGWAAVWALMGRVFAGRTAFARHCLIAFRGYLVLIALAELAPLAAASLATASIDSYQYLATWLVFGVVVFQHLEELGPTHLLAKLAGAAGVVAVAIAIQTLVGLQSQMTVDQPAYVQRLLPPGLRLSRPVSESAFLADAGKLQAQLDADRVKDQASPTPTSGGGSQ